MGENGREWGRTSDKPKRSGCNHGRVRRVNDVSTRSLSATIYTGYPIHLQTALRKLIRPGSLLAADFASSSLVAGAGGVADSSAKAIYRVPR